MTTHRNGIGHLKHTKGNRDYRRAHMVGAVRLIEQGKRTPDSFGTRMKAAILRWFR